MKRLYNSVYKLGSSESFECVGVVLILDLWEGTVHILRELFKFLFIKKATMVATAFYIFVYCQDA